MSTENSVTEMVQTREELYEAVRKRFKRDYFERILSNADNQEQANMLAVREGISIYEAWRQILSRRPRL